MKSLIVPMVVTAACGWVRSWKIRDTAIAMVSVIVVTATAMVFRTARTAHGHGDGVRNSQDCCPSDRAPTSISCGGVTRSSRMAQAADAGEPPACIALVETARRKTERAHLVELSAGESLQRLTSDAEFAWAAGSVGSDGPISSRARRRAATRGTSSRGARRGGALAVQLCGRLRRNSATVHDHPHIAMAQRAVRQALSAFPPAPPDTSTPQERHCLAEKARHLAKRK